MKDDATYKLRMSNGIKINSKHNLKDKNWDKNVMLIEDAWTMHIFGAAIIKRVSFSLKW